MVSASTLSSKASYFFFAVHSILLGLRSKDEYEQRFHNSSHHYLIFTLRCVKLLRTLHSWWQTIQYCSQQAWFVSHNKICYVIIMYVKCQFDLHISSSLKFSDFQCQFSQPTSSINHSCFIVNVMQIGEGYMEHNQH